eukprot:SAG11_NODE_5758_length_1469_cov_1.461314_2_plen_110_part_00
MKDSSTSGTLSAEATWAQLFAELNGLVPEGLARQVEVGLGLGHLPLVGPARVLLLNEGDGAVDVDPVLVVAILREYRLPRLQPRTRARRRVRAYRGMVWREDRAGVCIA